MEKFSSQEKKTALRIFWGQIRRSQREAYEQDKIKFLKKIPFFENLKKKQLLDVASIVYEREYREGEYIFEVGQPGAALFIIQHGEVAVELCTEHENSKSEVTQIAIIGKNSFLGELALLDESPRSASARVIVPTKVIALFRKDLDQIALTSPDITSNIYKSLATIIGNRLKATNELFEKRLKAAA
jgi:CRP/FNR family cyclic AMP-dependent transcriptional regulator